MRALRMRKRGDGVVLAPTDPDRPRRRPRVSAGFAVAGDSGRADGSRPQLHPLIGSSLRRLSRVDRLSAGDSHPGGRRHRAAATRGRGLRRRWPLLLPAAHPSADGSRRAARWRPCLAGGSLRALGRAAVPDSPGGVPRAGPRLSRRPPLRGRPAHRAAPAPRDGCHRDRCVHPAAFHVRLPAGPVRASTLASQMRASFKLMIAVGAVLRLLAPASAFADGDPASDYLPLQGYYTPYAGVSKPLTDALAEVVKETRAAGYPIKVA